MGRTQPTSHIVCVCVRLMISPGLLRCVVRLVSALEEIKRGLLGWVSSWERGRRVEGGGREGYSMEKTNKAIQYKGQQGQPIPHPHEIPLSPLSSCLLFYFFFPLSLPVRICLPLSLRFSFSFCFPILYSSSSPVYFFPLFSLDPLLLWKFNCGLRSLGLFTSQTDMKAKHLSMGLRHSHAIMGTETSSYS